MWVTTTPNKDNPLNWVYGEFGIDLDSDHALFTLDTLHNPYLPEAFKADLLKQYSGDLQMIELQGLFIPLSGNCFFKTMVLRSMLELDVREPSEVRREGIEIYKPAGIGKRYVAGIDIAEGRQAGDYTEGGTGNPDFQSLRIFDFNTGEDVCRIHCRWPLDEFLVEAVDLMTEYNKAYCGIEINYDRKAGQKLVDLGYPKDSVYAHTEGEYGWMTTSLTRMPMLREYEEAVRSRSATMYCKDTIMEHLSFIRNKQGRPEAAHNAHDDEVITGAIAWQMRKYATIARGYGRRRIPA